MQYLTLFCFVAVFVFFAAKACAPTYLNIKAINIRKKQTDKVAFIPHRHITIRALKKHIVWFNKQGFVLPHSRNVCTLFSKCLQVVFALKGECYLVFNKLQFNERIIACASICTYTKLTKHNLSAIIKLLLINKIKVKCKKYYITLGKIKQYYTKPENYVVHLANDELNKIILKNGSSLHSYLGSPQLFNGNNLLSSTSFNFNNFFTNGANMHNKDNWVHFAKEENGIKYKIKNYLSRDVSADIFEITAQCQSANACIANFNATLNTHASKEQSLASVWSGCHIAQIANGFVGFVCLNAKTKQKVSSNFASNVGNLELALSTQTLLKPGQKTKQFYAIVFGINKQQIIKKISKLKHGLFASTKVANKAVKSTLAQLIKTCNICTTNTLSCFKGKIAAYNKLIKTNFLPSVVLSVQNAAHFDKVQSITSSAKTLRNLGIKFNLIIITCNLENDAEHLLKNMQAKALAGGGIFVYIFDKNKLSSNIISYLNILQSGNLKQLAEFASSKFVSKNNSNNVKINTVVHKSIPHQICTTFTNCSGSKVTGTYYSTIPTNSARCGSIFPASKIVYQTASGIAMVSMVSGKSRTIKQNVKANLGKSIYYCTSIALKQKISLAAREQFELTSSACISAVTSRQNSKDFINQIQNINLSSKNLSLNKFFLLQLSLDNDEQTLCQLKHCIKTNSKTLFNAIISHYKTSVPQNIYLFMIQKVIGVKVIKNKIELLPITELTGNFDLSFICQGKQYSFKVSKTGSNYTVSYNNTEYKNVCQFNL